MQDSGLDLNSFLASRPFYSKFSPARVAASELIVLMQTYEPSVLKPDARNIGREKSVRSLQLICQVRP